MGVHYFYTWITRRYPLFRRQFDEQLMPGVDNFFIDLNGVLYRCAKDDSAIFKDFLSGKGFDEIFQAVVNYVNYIINHARPKKRLFIAIDGVAPRAKMNNQRQRRYHSAKNNADLNTFLAETLQTEPGAIAFKNNSISPGTEFMMMLIDHMNFFVQQKLAHDPAWRGLEVIFSGGDVPGEGEHKIMEWLRAWKQGPSFDVNESHCVYGNDSDLVFLCLSLHLPNMLIMREEMNWERRKVNSACKRSSSKEHMELLFINLLREYIQLEYESHRPKFKHAFDPERIIDDFIILSFFIGNDFLHKLYCMNTKKGNFDEIIGKFKDTLAGLDGYITDNGKVNWSRFMVLLKNILYMENKMINTTLGDMQDFMKNLEKGSHHLVLLGEGEAEDLAHEMDDFHAPDTIKEKDTPKDKDQPQEEGEEAIEFADARDEGEAELKAQVRNEFGPQIDPLGDNKTSSNFRPHELEFRIHHTKIKAEIEYIAKLLSVLEGGQPTEIAREKLGFYKKFFGLKSIEGLERICLEYLKGIQFVMYYYFRGCPSWGWFYPYFMSPFMSDILGLLDRKVKANPDLEFTFELEQPFRPFDQLVFILPKASFGLLPQVYSDIVLDEANGVTHFYPDSYEFQPFDGIKDYMWIAEIEVIDKAQLDRVLCKIDTAKLPEKDRLRNRVGTEVIYRYQPDAPIRKVKSTLAGLPDFEAPIEATEFSIRGDHPFDPSKMSLSLEGFANDRGYPSLFFIPGVKAVQRRVSRRANYDRIVLEIKPQVPEGYSGRYYSPRPHEGEVFFGYPFKLTGKVNTILTRDLMDNISEENESKAIKALLHGNMSHNTKAMHSNIQESVTHQLYYEQGIDLRIDNAQLYNEVYYEVEKSISSWKIADGDGKGVCAGIVQNYKVEPQVFAHSLLFRTRDSDAQQLNMSINENSFLDPGLRGINLLTGDTIETVDYGTEEEIRGQFRVVKENHPGVRRPLSQSELLETKWNLVDRKMLAYLGLRPSDYLVVWLLIDSFVIKTDPKQTSALVLGELFDIGLQFMDVLRRHSQSMSTVTDFCRVIRMKKAQEFALMVPKNKDEIPHAVYLSNEARDMLKGYIAEFPEVPRYIVKNAKNWGKEGGSEPRKGGRGGKKSHGGSKLPRDHNVKKFFAARREDGFDPNVGLFNIYKYILRAKGNSLKLQSALCVNAAGSKIAKLTKEVDRAVASKRDKKPNPKPLRLDKNCVIINEPSFSVVGPTFKYHPEYPYIGDRVVFTSNKDKHVQFGLLGTVIGTYKLDIEILFDEPFVGGTDLKGRCAPFRGGVAHFYDIFNLTRWGKTLNTRKECSVADRPGNKELPEWDGKIDLMNVIRRLSEFRRLFEHETLKGKPRQPKGQAQGKKKLASRSKPFDMGQQQTFKYYQPKTQAGGHNNLMDDLSLGAPPPGLGQGGYYQPRYPQAKKGSFKGGPGNDLLDQLGGIGQPVRGPDGVLNFNKGKKLNAVRVTDVEKEPSKRVNLAELEKGMGARPKKRTGGRRGGAGEGEYEKVSSGKKNKKE